MLIRKSNLFAALTLITGFGVIAPVLSHAVPPSPTVLADEDEKPQRGAAVVGTIVSVDLANNTFTIKAQARGGGEEKEIAVQINDSTKYMAGKEASTREAVLVKGEKVRVKHKDGVALAVMSMKKVEKPE